MCGLPFCLFAILIVFVIVLRNAPLGEAAVLPKSARVAYWSCLPVLQAIVGFVGACCIAMALDGSANSAAGVIVGKFVPYFITAWVGFFSWLGCVSFAMGDDAYYAKRSGARGASENLRETLREFPAVVGWSLLQSLVVGGGVFIVVSLIKFLIGLMLNGR